MAGGVAASGPMGIGLGGLTGGPYPQVGSAAAASELDILVCGSQASGPQGLCCRYQAVSAAGVHYQVQHCVVTAQRVLSVLLLCLQAGAVSSQLGLMPPAVLPSLPASMPLVHASAPLTASQGRAGVYPCIQRMCHQHHCQSYSKQEATPNTSCSNVTEWCFIALAVGDMRLCMTVCRPLPYVHVLDSQGWDPFSQYQAGSNSAHTARTA